MSEQPNAVYFLRSIGRNLAEFRELMRGQTVVLGPSIGSEVLSDNMDWLECYIEQLEAAEIEKDTP